MDRRPNRFWVKWGAVAAIVAAGLALFAYLRTPATATQSVNHVRNSGNENVCADQAKCTIAVQPATTTTTYPQPVQVNADQNCPSPDPTVPPPVAVEICVLYWCHGYQLTDQGQPIPTEYQIKLRPLITNLSSSPVNISVDRPHSALRLLIQASDVPQNWQPRPGTLDYGDVPFTINYDGAEYWAIAPNRTATEVSTSAGLWTGFATTWDYRGTLAPNAVAGSAQPVRDSEDLVFDVPLQAPAQGQPIVNVLGFALLDYGSGSPTVKAIALTNGWQRQEDPSAF